MAETKLPKWSELEKQDQAAAATAKEEALAAREAPAARAGAEGAGGAAGLQFIDKMSLGLLPALHDKLVDIAGEERMGPKYSDIMAQQERDHPLAGTVGGMAGMALPIGGALRVASALKGIPVVGNLARGAAAVGGENVADQAVRTQTEDRPFNPAEAVGSAALGAINPLGLLSGAGKFIGRQANPLMQRIIGAAGKELPDATAAARQTLEGEAAAFTPTKQAMVPGRGGSKGPAAPEAPAPPPPPGPAFRPLRPGETQGPPDASLLKPDPTFAGGIGPAAPPLQGVRPSQIPQGSPAWQALQDAVAGRTPPLRTPMPPPVAPPPSLLDSVGRGADVASDIWTTTRGASRAGIDIGAGEKQNLRRRKRKASSG